MIGTPPAYEIGLLKTHLNEHNVSWSGGLDWQATDTLLAYANVSRGYKAGGFPTLPASYYLAVAPVTQEKVTDYEAGFKAQFLGRRLLVNGAAFYYDYTNKQLKSRIIDPIFGVLTALVNIPKSTIRGAEFEVHARPLTGDGLGILSQDDSLGEKRARDDLRLATTLQARLRVSKRHPLCILLVPGAYQIGKASRTHLYQPYSLI
jgi:outer membrane receptor protein involved in Fe transport